nr:MAG TPA: hypothetical protein [Caudoviricetes sp.]
MSVNLFYEFDKFCVCIVYKALFLRDNIVFIDNCLFKITKFVPTYCHISTIFSLIYFM